MKTILLSALVLSSITTSAQVPNGGFENWAGGNPVSWSALSGGAGLNTVTQHSPGYAGSSAAKGTVISFMGNSLGPFLSSVDMNNEGFAVSQNYAALNFYYQTSLDPLGSLVVVASMEDGLEASVGAAGMSIGGSVSSWTFASVPFFYNGIAEECIITFAISHPNIPPVGDYFIVDEVTLGASVGLDENQLSFDLEKISPNPASDYFSVYYSLSVSSDLEILLSDISGRLIKQVSIGKETAGKHKYILDVNDVQAGSYLVTLITEKGRKTQKVQIVK